MNETTTTNPLPVTGVQLNDTFPAEGSLQPTQVARNLQVFPNALDTNKNDLYLDTIRISGLNAPKQKIYEFNTLDPFKGKITYLRGNANQFNLVFAPWYALQAIFSSYGNYDVEYVLRPKKVNDCRVILDVFFGYSGETFETPNNDTWFQNDGMTFNMDSVESEFVIPVPMYSMFDNYPFRLMRVLEENFNFLDQPPIFFPNVNTAIFIRSPYQPNSIQPDEIDIQVYARVKFKGLQKYALIGHNYQIYRQVGQDKVYNYTYSIPFFMKPTTRT